MTFRDLSLVWVIPFFLLAACSSTSPAPEYIPPSGGPGPETTCDALPGNGIQSGQHCLGGMYPDASAQSYGDAAGVKVFVALHLPLTGDFVILSNGDHLTATIDGETQPLLYDDTSGRVEYDADFPAATSGTVTIQLLRPPQLRSATITIPVAPPFSLPNPPTQMKLGKAVNFGISPPPADDTVGVYVDGPCVYGPDTASSPLQLPVVDGGASFNTSDAVVGVENCNVTTHVRVETVGTIDLGFSPGSASGLQERDFASAFSP